MHAALCLDDAEGACVLVGLWLVSSLQVLTWQQEGGTLRLLGRMLCTPRSRCWCCWGRGQPPVQQGPQESLALAIACRLLPEQLSGWRMLQGR